MAAAYEGIINLNVNNGCKTFIDNILPAKGLRYNDGKIDPRGRFLVGTTGYKRFADKEGYLFSYEKGKARILLDGISISNGISFSPDNRYLYYIDTPTLKVGRYIYDMETGNISFDKYVAVIEDGMPDGMCTDKEGMLWVAHWNGYGLTRHDPETGEITDDIKLPVRNVTSCCFGGAGMDYLYITTAKHEDNSESEMMAGSLFKCKVNCGGA